MLFSNLSRHRYFDYNSEKIFLKRKSLKFLRSTNKCKRMKFRTNRNALLFQRTHRFSSRYLVGRWTIPLSSTLTNDALLLFYNIMVSGFRILWQCQFSNICIS
uniref:Ovule protein n=1 Tax=Heterorhabditis bacteriophora TaxID=37862 RepID=A0A1I7W7Z4_HETBA